MTSRRIAEKRGLKTADEQDLDWRRYLCYLQRAGATAQIKREARRRERRDRKREDRDGQW